MADEQHPAWAQIEQGAKASDDPRWPTQFAERPGEHEIELSKAISLKRLADDMNGIRVSLMQIVEIENLKGQR